MAEKEQQVHPLAPADKSPRSDEESASSLQSKELKTRKRIKYAVYIAAFAVFQTAVILVFALTVMRIKTRATASFDLKINAQVTVKNTNFGHYKFDSGTMTFLYDGVIVGEAIIPKARARARARSTQKLEVTVEVDTSALTTTAGPDAELSSNVLTLNSQARLRGQVELMKGMKKKKSPEMNCTLTFNASTGNLQDLNCK